MNKQHDQWGGMDIADHCRAMQRADIMRRTVTHYDPDAPDTRSFAECALEMHYDWDAPEGQATVMRGPTVNTIQIPPQRTSRAAFLWPIAALLTLAAASLLAML